MFTFNPVTFVTGNPLSYADVNALTENARVIDALSYRGRRAWTNAMMRYAWENDFSPTVVMRGAFQYRTGVTNLNIIAEASFPGGGTHTLQVYLNGILRHSATWVTSRTNYFFNITSYGFADLDIVEVEVRDAWTGADGQPIVLDAYIDALSGGFAAYPTPTAFGDISAANLTALMTAQTWCYDRINRTDQPMFMGPMFLDGYGYNTSNEALLFDGGIEKTNGSDRLLIGLRYQIVANQSERVAVRLDGTQVATQDFTLGQSGEMEFNIDLTSFGTDVPIRVTIIQVVLTPPAANTRELGSRFTITDIFTRRNTYTAPTLPPAVSPTTMTFSTLQGYLNQIRVATNDSATRIGSAVGAFNRQRVFRWQPGADDNQNAYFVKRFVAKGRRAHDFLWVRGKNLKIGWGALDITPNLGELADWKPQYEADLVSGDEVQTKLVGFDLFEGLVPSMEYYVYGERLVYLAEQVRT
jgi:hypothetical protein